MASPGGIRAGKAFVELYMKDTKIAAGFKRIGAWAKKMGNEFRAAGRKIFMVGAALSLALGVSARTFGNFEQQMANVSTMLDEPEKHMKTFKKSILEMSSEFGESTDTLAKGLYDILSASIPPEKALAVLAVSAKAAKAGITDTGIAADAITTILNSYGLSAEYAMNVSDLLFAIVKRGKTTFAELAPSIGMVATTASVAGVTLDEFGAGISIMTRHGVKTENAITSLNAIISSFLKPTDEAAKYARTLGFEMSTAAIKSKGLENILRKVSTLSPDDMAKLFPNVRGIRGLLAALQNMKEFTSDIDVMRNRAGKTEIAFKKMTNTLNHTFAQVVQSAKKVMVFIGDALAEDIKRVSKLAIEKLNTIAAWVEKNKGLVVSVAKGVVALLAVGAALSVVGSALVVIGFAAHGIGAIITLATTFVGILGAVKVAIIGAAAALKGIALASVPGILAAIFNPLTLTIGAIGFVAAVLMKTTGAWDGYKKVASDAISVIKTDFSNTYGGIVAALKAGEIKVAWKIVCAFINLEWARVWSACKETWLIVSNLLRNGYNLLTTDMVSAFLGASYGIKRAWMAVGHFFEQLWLGIKAGAVNAWNYSLRLMNKLPGVDFKVGQDINYSVEAAKLDKEQAAETQKEKAKYEADKKTNKELYEAQRKQNQVDLNKGINASSASLSKAAADLADAVKEAKKAAQKDAAAKTAANKASSQKSKANVWNQAQAQIEKVSSVGSFSGAAVAANGGVIKNLQEKIVSITEKIEEHAEKIANEPKTYPGFTQ